MDDNNKNSVKNGVKRQLPNGDMQDIGKPHPTRIGNETSVRKSCTWSARAHQYATAVKNQAGDRIIIEPTVPAINSSVTYLLALAHELIVS